MADARRGVKPRQIVEKATNDHGRIWTPNVERRTAMRLDRHTVEGDAPRIRIRVSIFGGHT